MTDRELMQQALEALEWNLPVIEDYGDHEQLNRQHRAIIALCERLAQPQQSHEINADTDAIGMAIHDALVCGTGVVKLWLDAGKMNFDHVSIKDFAVFGDELKWRAAHTGKEKMND
jgi:hypothetical protein